jgi:hypothetical protein
MKGVFENISPQWVQNAFYALLAAAGGAFGYVMRAMEANNPIMFWRVVVEAGGAAFVGVLVAFTCHALNLNQEWTGVIVGICGWLGANATIRMLEKVVDKKLGIGDDNGT